MWRMCGSTRPRRHNHNQHLVALPAFINGSMRAKTLPLVNHKGSTMQIPAVLSEHNALAALQEIITVCICKTRSIARAPPALFRWLHCLPVVYSDVAQLD